jgi:Zn-dependent protease with chaperone function
VAFRLLSVLVRLALLTAAFFVVSGAIAYAVPREAQDRRVDRIAARVLLQTPAADLVDRNRQNEAEKLAGYERPLFFLQAGAEIAALLLLWQTGLAARIRDALRRAFRYQAPTRFVFGGIMALTALGAAFPFALWGHRLARLAQLTPARLLPWAVAYGVETLLIALGVGLLAAIVLALVDAIRTWYLVVAAGVVAFTLGYAAVLPVVEDAFVAPVAYQPAAAVGARIAEIERKAGFANVPIVVERIRDRASEASAHVEGIGPWRRIVIEDTELATSTPSEITYAVAHELAHMAAADEIRIAFALALLVIVSTALAVTVTDRIGFRRDDDPLVRLALVAAFIGIAYLALLPGYNAFDRALETRADRAAVALTGDRAAAIRSFVRYTDDQLQPLCPPRIVRLYLYDHEAYGTRIAEMQGLPSPCR